SSPCMMQVRFRLTPSAAEQTSPTQHKETALFRWRGFLISSVLLPMVKKEDSPRIEVSHPECHTMELSSR
ncbi:hypothetical protein ACP3WZ_27085, partial [Salmonella enterica]|uniref:hypothetical protein n=1 Tax=Salmonella enterica TaxID=28901 RepID=UPI003CF302C2